MSHVVDPQRGIQLAAQLARLPPDVNPYQWLHDAVKAEIPVLGGPTFRGLLFFAIASHIVALICNLGIVAQKIRDRQFWIIKRVCLPQGSYLCLNSTASLAVLASIYCSTAIPAMWLQAMRPLPELFDHLQLLTLLSEGFLILAGWTECYGCVFSSISFQQGGVHSMKRMFNLRPRVVDTILCALPIVFITVFLPLIILLDKHNTAAIRALRTMLEMLSSRSEVWTSGRMDLQVAAKTLALFGRFNVQYTKFIGYIAAAAAFGLGFLLLLLLIWLPFLLSHISMILHQIKVLRNAGLQIKSNLAGQMTHTSQPATATEQTIARLVSVCKKRAVSAIAILTIVCFDVGILLLPIIKPWELTLEAPLYQTFIAGPFVVYAVVGTPISVVLLWQCFQSRAVRQGARQLTQASNGSMAITIVQSTQIDAESLADESMEVYKKDDYELKRSPWSAA